MKKFKLLLSLALTALVITGCGKSDKPADDKKTTQSTEKKDDKKDKKQDDKVAKKPVVTVTTSFLNDMVKNLAGDLVDVKLIMPAGEDPHLYVAKPEDLKKIQEANLLLYHGLHFEGKMYEILEKSNGKQVTDKFPADKIGKMEEDGEMITDPHFWFDVDLYKMAVERASEHLQDLLKDKKDVVKANTDKYLKELTELDKYNKEKLESIPKERRFLITPHDAFNYFSRRYDIEVKAPQGVSTESEVASSDISETVNFIVEHGIKAIFAESTTDPARMEKLKEEVKAKGKDVTVVSGEGEELFSDSLAPEGQSGDSYISMYKHNTDLMAKYLK